MLQAVEVIKGVTTSDETLRYGGDFKQYIGKEPITVNRDIGGFILNNINMLSNVEAMRIPEQRVASAEDIDKGVPRCWSKIGAVGNVDSRRT